MRIKILCIGITLLLTSVINLMGQTGSIEGVVSDKKTGETLVGATIVIAGTTTGTTTDLDGKFVLGNLAPGLYNISVNFISYQRQTFSSVEVASGKPTTLNVTLNEVSQKIDEVVVSGTKKTHTEVSMIASIKSSQLVVSGISSQQIAKSQDKDASEVVRRIPGISIQNGKFIIIRGLSQRYNNVWMNGSAVPSSEADSRAFSFDMIPSSQIDNITIVKSPAPEYPADFSGGFVQITTKDVSDSNAVEIGYGLGLNDQTQYKNFKIAPKGGLDYLGVDDGTRGLSGIVPYRLNNDLPTNSAQINDVSQHGFNNSWTVESFKSFARPDQRISFMLNRKYSIANNKTLGFSFASGYNHTYRAYHNMENALIGSYDIVNDRPNYFFKYNDNQYTVESKLGTMLNLSYIPNSRTKILFHNILNLDGKNRLTDRTGYQFNSGFYQEQQEFLYNSRLTYSGQLSGNHKLDENQKLDWDLGYSLSKMNQPDRRDISRDRSITDTTAPLAIDFNDTKRLFLKLQENVFSGATNYQYKITQWANFAPTIKIGVYGEYKDRDYNTRSFYYILNSTANQSLNYLSNGEVFSEPNLGINGVYIYEDTRNTDSYKASNRLAAGYAAITIPLKKFNIYGGVRLENNVMEITKYVSLDPTNFNTKMTSYSHSDIFPSINASYNITDKQLVRLAYGASVNRPEFRELSTSTYYDFDIFSFVVGNANLKIAYIHNIDLRYEIYPKSGEMVSFALFYKNFKDPIESTYYENSGGYTYSFTNAKSANNIGAEIDLKKGLEAIGIKNLSLSFNAAYIYSRVKFDQSNTLEHDRPMQGQSPYLINAGLFYQNNKNTLNCGILYNVIGERIVGVGRVLANNPNISVPDIYELPRNLVDVTFNIKLTHFMSLSGAVKNILNDDVVLQQTAKFTDSNGASQVRNQIKQKYNPGRNYSLSLSFKF
ncbi:MAG TPA: TonB-dependent receptor [Williamwhitmania sp.]|nr:TonB-dependent receptor [Williamwhitmania sp.]